MSQKKSHISSEMYEKYLSGQLSKEEAYEVEKIMQSFELYDDALEGLESLNTTHLKQEIDLLKEKVSLPNHKSEGKTLWFKIAAAVLLLITSSLIIWQIVPNSRLKNELGSIQKEESPLWSPENNNDDFVKANDTTLPIKEKKDRAEVEAELALNNRLEDKSNRRSEVPQTETPVAQKITIPEPVLANSGILEELLEDEFLIEVEESEEVMEEMSLDDIVLESASLANSTEENKSTQGVLPPTTASLVDTSSRLASDEYLDSLEEGDHTSANYTLKKVREKSEEFLVSSARPIGGFENFNKYLAKNNIRRKPKKKHQSVTIQFEVKVNSSLQNIHIIRGDTILGHQIIPILLNGPQWIPSQDSSKNVVIEIFYKKSEKK